ncbi:MAG TPA: hypothetical protein VKU02_29730 [Gemmataceae bacterium]|nr:hypothetical protein [Gemmataceae bacterium]
MSKMRLTTSGPVDVAGRDVHQAIGDEWLDVRHRLTTGGPVVKG